MKKLLLFNLLVFLGLNFLAAQESACTVVETGKVIAKDVNDEFDGRRCDDHYDTDLSSPGILQAYLELDNSEGNSFDQEYFDERVDRAIKRSSANFELLSTVRYLFLSKGIPSKESVEKLSSIPMWRDEENTTGNFRDDCERGPRLCNTKRHDYSTENHMISWISADFLLGERLTELGLPWEAAPRTRKRLEKFLDVKIKYGFYEYFTFYYAFTGNALLNLYDFAKDPVIKEKAGRAFVKMMKDITLVTNNMGQVVSTSSRLSENGLTDGRPIGKSSYLLTGIGFTQGGGQSRLIEALKTTSINKFVDESGEEQDLSFSEIQKNAEFTGFTSFTYGHPIEDFKSIYGDLNRKDRTAFQYTASAFASSKVIVDTFNLLIGNIVGDIVGLSLLPLTLILDSSLSGMYIGHSPIRIYNNENVVLSSKESEEKKGKLGIQPVPVAANIVDQYISIRAGKPSVGFERFTSMFHYPYTKQVDNTALIMFRPSREMRILSTLGPIAGKILDAIALGINTAVSADNLNSPINIDRYSLSNFTTNVYTEWEEGLNYEGSSNYNPEGVFTHEKIGKWTVSKHKDEESYIAVLKHCEEETEVMRDDKTKLLTECVDPDGQTWAFVVGNENMYGSYRNFKKEICEASFKEEWIFSPIDLESRSVGWDYKSTLKIGTKNLTYTWKPRLTEEVSLLRPDMIGNSFENSGNCERFNDNLRASTIEDAVFRIAPNPATNYFRVYVPEGKVGIKSISVSNRSGKIVYNKNNVRLDSKNRATVRTTRWRSGPYVVIIKSTDGKTSTENVLIK